MLRLNGVIIVILISFLYGCSTKPSVNDGEKAFENKLIEDIKNEELEVTGFKKINAVSGEEAGIKFYIMEYEGEIRYLKDRIYSGWDSLLATVAGVDSHRK